MANFAQIDPDTNLVINIASATHEAIYSGICGNPSHFIEYKEDGTLRNIAVVGGYYLPNVEKFTNQKVSDSWTFNAETNQYDPPNPQPELTEEQYSSGFRWKWDEGNYKAGESGWIYIKTNK